MAQKAMEGSQHTFCEHTFDIHIKRTHPHTSAHIHAMLTYQLSDVIPRDDEIQRRQSANTKLMHTVSETREETHLLRR